MTLEKMTFEKNDIRKNGIKTNLELMTLEPIGSGQMLLEQLEM